MNRPELSTEVAERGGRALVALRGELDIHGEPVATAALERAAATGLPVVLDLRGLEFIDSSGLLVVVTWSRRLAERFSVVRGPAHVQRPFASAGLDGLLPFTDAPPA